MPSPLIPTRGNIPQNSLRVSNQSLYHPAQEVSLPANAIYSEPTENEGNVNQINEDFSQLSPESKKLVSEIGTEKKLNFPAPGHKEYSLPVIRTHDKQAPIDFPKPNAGRSGLMTPEELRIKMQGMGQANEESAHAMVRTPRVANFDEVWGQPQRLKSQLVSSSGIIGGIDDATKGVFGGSGSSSISGMKQAVPKYTGVPSLSSIEQKTPSRKVASNYGKGVFGINYDADGRFYLGRHLPEPDLSGVV